MCLASLVGYNGAFTFLLMVGIGTVAMATMLVLTILVNFVSLVAIFKERNHMFYTK